MEREESSAKRQRTEAEGKSDAESDAEPAAAAQANGAADSDAESDAAPAGVANSDAESDADSAVTAGVANAVAAASQAADSDAESDAPDKVSDAGADSDAESAAGGAKSGGEGAAEGEGEDGGKKKKKTKGDDSDSDSESVKSSSSSSSSKSKSSSSSASKKALDHSDQESDSDDDALFKPAAAPEKDDPEAKKKRDLESIRGAQLKRDDLHSFLKLPEEALETAIKRSFVRLTMADACVIAEVVEIVESTPYKVKLQTGRERTVKVSLRCRRGSSNKVFKILNISNQDITELEFEQWKELIKKSTGVDPDVYIGQLDVKAEELQSARTFHYSEAVIAEMIRRKTNTEFEAQKESRMKSLMQCALSQMHISGIRDSEPHELQRKYTQAQQRLSFLQASSTKTQDKWFKDRADTFSIKEINRRNLRRQTEADDRALKYTYMLEEQAAVAAAKGAKVQKNPFERRPCRPVVAWDTSLTEEGGDEDAPEKKKDDKPAEAPKGSGDVMDPAHPAPSSVARVKAVVGAHRRANLLFKVGAMKLAVA